MKVVYVAGPFRGPNGWRIEQNVRRAEEYGFKIAELGAMPIIPHANTRFFHGALPDEFFLEGTLELLRRCDAIFLTPGWEMSSGSRGERNEAHARGIPDFYELGALRHWLEQFIELARVVR